MVLGTLCASTETCCCTLEHNPTRVIGTKAGRLMIDIRLVETTDSDRSVWGRLVREDEAGMVPSAFTL